MEVNIYRKRKDTNIWISQDTIEITQQDIENLAMEKYKKQNQLDDDFLYSSELKLDNSI